MDAHRRSPDNADMSSHPEPEDPVAAGDELPPEAMEELKHLVDDDTDHLLQLAHRVGELHERIATQTSADVNGLYQILGSKRRLLFVNFMAGLARGAGFFLGVTLIGGLIIGSFGYFFDATARLVGLDDVTFRGLVRTFAEEAIEAKKVWEDVNQDDGPADPDADSANTGTDDNRTPPPPRDG
jgi:hypothetical protein